MRLPFYSAIQKSQRIAFSALARNRLQTILTLTGMMIGVATVLAMVALGTGAQKAIQDQVRSAGMNVIVVSAGNYRMKQQWTSDGETEEQQAADDSDSHKQERQRSSWRAVEPGAILLHVLDEHTRLPAGREDDPENLAGLGGSDKLSLADADAVKRLPGVQYVSAGLAENARVGSASKNWFTRLHGESPDLPKIRRTWTLLHGRFFTATECADAAEVAVIGSVVSDHLFGAVNPVGSLLPVKGHNYRIVGEIASASWMVAASQGDDQFDAIYIPVTSAQSAMGRRQLDTLTVSTESTGAVTKVSRSIRELLRIRHELRVDEADDFAVASEAHKSLTRGGMRLDVARSVVGNVSYLDKVTLEELGKTLDRASRTMTSLLAAVAGVSLLVGGIGIMNIMLLSVSERTREIGIRRAVGARTNEVLTQFLMEAVMLSVAGGTFGIVAGIVLARSISLMAQWSASIPVWSVILSFGISVAVGIIFGYYPAREASRVSPMTSLRNE